MGMILRGIFKTPLPDGAGLRPSPRIYRAFQYGFALWTGLLFCLCLFAHNNPFLPLGRPQLAVAALLCAGALAAVFWCWERFLPMPRHPRRIAAVLLAVYGVLLAAFGLLMQVNYYPNWDFPAVFGEAYAFVTTGAPPGEYFTYYANNAPLYCVYVGWFFLLRAVGVSDLMSGLVLLNCACILLALYWMYRIAARLWDEKRALLVLCAAFCYPAFLLYAPIAYTDTLTLPLVTGAALLWLRARDAAAEGDAARARRRALAAFALAALGAVLKISAAILTIAFVLDLLFAWRGRARWITLAASAACFAALLLGGNTLARSVLPEYDEDPVPFTHWIMMGLHGDGGYWDPDYQLTLQYDTYEARAAFTRQEIARRVREMGAAGLARHCGNKLSYIFSDGTCFAPRKLDIGPKYPNPLHQWIIRGGKYAGILYYAADSLQLCLLALCAWGGLLAARRGETRLTFLRVAWFGLGLFLLIWEARSRYLINFLPLFLLCAAGGLPSPGRIPTGKPPARRKPADSAPAEQPS